MMSRIAAEHVREILQELPERYREVLTCRFLLNLSIRDSAVMMGLTETNVRVVQYRALKHTTGIEHVAGWKPD
jgi:RNA polymerase sigma-70 factor, ECF subfamily